MKQVALYSGLIILISIFPVSAFAQSMGMNLSHGFGGCSRNYEHGHYGRYLHSSDSHHYFVKNHHPKCCSPRFLHYYYPGLGIWGQDNTNRQNITIEQINLILSPTDQLDIPKSPSEKKTPPQPHMETINGEDNTIELDEEAGIDAGDTVGHIVVYDSGGIKVLN